MTYDRCHHVLLTVCLWYLSCLVAERWNTPLLAFHCTHRVLLTMKTSYESTVDRSIPMQRCDCRLHTSFLIERDRVFCLFTPTLLLNGHRLSISHYYSQISCWGRRHLRTNTSTISPTLTLLQIHWHWSRHETILPSQMSIKHIITHTT